MTMNMYDDSNYSNLIPNGTTTLTGTMTSATIIHLILLKNLHILGFLYFPSNPHNHDRKI